MAYVPFVLWANDAVKFTDDLLVSEHIRTVQHRVVQHEPLLVLDHFTEGLLKFVSLMKLYEAIALKRSQSRQIYVLINANPDALAQGSSLVGSLIATSVLHLHVDVSHQISVSVPGPCTLSVVVHFRRIELRL